MEDTGFHVLCNTVDESIYVRLISSRILKTGDIDPVQSGVR